MKLNWFKGVFIALSAIFYLVLPTVISGMTFSPGNTCLVPAAPTLLSVGAESRHLGDPDGTHNYGIHLTANISDAEGLTDIASVIVTGPTGTAYTLIDENSDGWYDLWTENLSAPVPTGTYTFRVTDKSSNYDQETDEITAIIGFPANQSPKNSSVTLVSAPQFSWNSVTAAVSYTVMVTKNGNQVWSKSDITATSVIYNSDGLASEALILNNAYQWKVYCVDANGNRGEQYSWINFIYASSASSPIVKPSALSGHFKNNSGSDEYYIDLNAQVFDNQGLGTIASVVVSGPGGFSSALTDPENDGYYTAWVSTYNTPPSTGSYVFRATDTDTNWGEAVDLISGVVAVPDNLNPRQDEVITTSTPTLRWDAVPGTHHSDVWINNSSGTTIWWVGGLLTNSVVFNFDGRSSSSLAEGSVYYFYVRCYDAENNWGENDARFAFSTHVSKPVTGGFNVISFHGGDAKGTEEYGYDCFIEVIDPQGRSDISSVKLKTPDGKEFPLADTDSDGRWDAWIRGLSASSPSGICTFTVTDLSNNTATTQDNLTGWMPVPQNLRPSYNEFVTTSTPVFSWNVVDGSSNYQLHLWTGNNPPMWGGINVSNRISITYNEDGKGPALQLGNRYTWDLRCFDADGNYGYHYPTEFYYSNDLTTPIIYEQLVVSYHFSDPRDNQYYGLAFRARVVDPQGSADIASVTVIGPDNAIYSLKNDGDEYYSLNFNTEKVIPVTGVYKFKVTDKSGNFKEVTDNLTGVLDYPKNLNPSENSIVATSTPVFSWSAIPGAINYYIQVNNSQNTHIWSKNNLTTVSATFNDDGLASEGLVDGASYTFSVRGWDADGNYGEQHSLRFTYSTSVSNPVINMQSIRSLYNVNMPDLSKFWRLDAEVHIADPQGITDIDSVWIEGTSGYHAKLTDDNQYGSVPGDGIFRSEKGLSGPPGIGTYTIKALDKSGNISSKQVNLTANLDFPKNVTPKYNSKQSVLNFPITWDKVENATHYYVYVDNFWDHARLWGISMTQNSTTYNCDGTGGELVDGGVYLLTVNAIDNDNNVSGLSGIKIVYRINNRQAVYVDGSYIPGIENGKKGSPYNTLNEGVLAAIPDDTVFVAKGTYAENIDDIGSVKLIGENPEKTFINGNLILRSSPVTVSGFTFNTPNGTAIEIQGSVLAEIVNNVFKDNPDGIYQGGQTPSETIIRNNTFTGAKNAAIGLGTPGSAAVIYNNIFAYNQAAIYKSEKAVVTNSYNLYHSNASDNSGFQRGEGEIFNAPGFINYDRRELSLFPSSKCIDAGNPDGDNDSNQWLNDPDDMDPDTTRKDIGALFFDQRTLIPAAPAGLNAISCNDSIHLKWRQNKELYFHHYSIVGATTETPITELATIRNVTDTTLIMKLEHGQKYFFRIRNVNRGGAQSSYSDQVSEVIGTGVIPRIKAKWNDVLICYNVGDSITQYQWFKNGNAITGATNQYYLSNKTPGAYHVVTTDSKGCSNSSRIINLTGLSSSIYPNPVSGRFTFMLDEEAEGEAHVMILNSYGTAIMEYKAFISESRLINDIPADSLENGLYYIKVVLKDNKVYSGKFLVMK